MIDATNLKAPGWQRVVAELSAPAPDDRAFVVRLLACLTQVSGARQGVLLVVDRSSGEVSEGGASGAGANSGVGAVEPRAISVWPPATSGGAAGGGGELQIESVADVKSAALGASEVQQIRVYGLEEQSGFYEAGSGRGFVVGVPVNLAPVGAGGGGGGGGDSAAESVAPKLAITLLIESRSRQAMQTTLALIEVLAGYVHGHRARQQYRRSRAAAAALDLSSKLLAAVNYARSFKGAALQLCNDVARQLGADRVALGWVHGVGESGAVRVEALSDTEHIDRRLAMIQKIEAAMDECLDQEQPVVYPPPSTPASSGASESATAGEGGESGDAVLAMAITHAHKGLASHDARLKVLSVPLRCEVEGPEGLEGRVLGVMTIETTDQARIDAAGVEVLQATLDLIAPAMRLRRSDDRALATRAWASTVRSGKWAVGPKHTVWKLLGLVGLVGLVLASLVPVSYRVSAPLTLEPREMRTVAAPFDGQIKSLGAGVEAGRVVKKGDVLLTLDTTELELRALEARSQVQQALKRADALRAQGGSKLGEAQQAEAEADQARAKLDLMNYQIERSKIVAPMDGTILEGQLKDRVGSSIRQGDPLYRVASLDEMVAKARVDDSDVGYLVLGGKGALATRADPKREFAFEIEQIVPLAQPRDGKNAFEVRVRPVDGVGAIPPGTEGIGKFEAGRHSLVWIASRRVLDALRLKLWW